MYANNFTYKASLAGIACLLTAKATTLTYQAGPLSEYGMSPTTTCPATAAGNCAAAASANSLAFLKNHYPDTYGSSGIIPHQDDNTPAQDLDMTRDMLAAGWDAGNGPRSGIYNHTNPTYSEDWYQAMMNWLNDFAPNTTGMAGMTRDDINAGNPLNKGLKGGAYPTWDFLLFEIQQHEDVEIGIRRADGSAGHVVTLVGLTVDDVNGNGTWDPGESRSAQFSDPSRLGPLAEGMLSVGADGRLLLPFPQDQQPGAYIDIAIAESPIPEPATYFLVILSFAAAWTLQSRRNKIGKRD